jgi:hypothetical protein
MRASTSSLIWVFRVRLRPFVIYNAKLTFFTISASFQQQDYKHLVFPSMMYVDYVRVYQRSGVHNGLTCDPSNRPTANYINKCASPGLSLRRIVQLECLFSFFLAI